MKIKSSLNMFIKTLRELGWSVTRVTFQRSLPGRKAGKYLVIVNDDPESKKLNRKFVSQLNLNGPCLLHAGGNGETMVIYKL